MWHLRDAVARSTSPRARRTLPVITACTMGVRVDALSRWKRTSGDDATAGTAATVDSAAGVCAKPEQRDVEKLRRLLTRRDLAVYRDWRGGRQDTPPQPAPAPPPTRCRLLPFRHANQEAERRRRRLPLQRPAARQNLRPAHDNVAQWDRRRAPADRARCLPRRPPPVAAPSDRLPVHGGDAGLFRLPPIAAATNRRTGSSSPPPVDDRRAARGTKLLKMRRQVEGRWWDDAPAGQAAAAASWRTAGCDPHAGAGAGDDPAAPRILSDDTLARIRNWIRDVQRATDSSRASSGVTS